MAQKGFFSRAQLSSTIPHHLAEIRACAPLREHAPQLDSKWLQR